MSSKLSYDSENQVVTIKNAEKAIQLTIVKTDIIRVFQDHNDQDISYAIEGNKITKTAYEMYQDINKIVVKTAKLIVEVSEDLTVNVFNNEHQPLVLAYHGSRSSIDKSVDEAHKSIIRSEGHEVSSVNEGDEGYYEIVNELDEDEQFYGLGDKTGYLNKRGYAYDNWNYDEPRPHIESHTNLYKSIPVLFGLKQGRPYGVFYDNTYRSHFDLGKESSDYYIYSAVDGNVNYYILGGDTLKDVVSNYTYLTGTTPLPQKWMLGYQQSRWGYSMSQEKVEEIVNKFAEYEIPLEAVHFDIDYMEGYRVFTWDKDKFANPKKFLSDLKERGVRVVPILDPGVKQDDDYEIYQEGLANGYFATNEDGSVYINRVWPGQSAFPDFGKPAVREWWAKHCKFLLDNGAAGIWTDMNEPATFDGDMPEDVVMTDETQKSSLKKLNNVYGHNMAKASYEGIKNVSDERPYVITRAAYAGTQKYAAVWTGDNQSLWPHLAMMIPQVSNMGLSGFSYVGADIGGFSADTTPELLTRWIEAALFSPMFRNHSALQVRDQEPWVFGDKVLDIYRKYVNLRYNFIPYMYDLFATEEDNGLPIFRPLVLNYPEDKRVREMNDEYMIGDDILVAPVVQQGQDTRAVYLPAGEWIDFWSGVTYSGQSDILVKAPIEKLPFFIKKNTILPWGKNVMHITEVPEDSMTFRLFGDDGKYIHYQDNGVDLNYKDGEFNTYRITVSDLNDVSVKLENFGYDQPYSKITVMVNGFSKNFTLDSDSKAYILE